jgi:hypothetical protein
MEVLCGAFFQESDGLFCERFFNRFCELVGAGCAAAALCAFKAGNELLCVHAFCESGKTLCIAAATAVKANVVHFAVFDLEVDVSGANTVRFICEFFSHFYFTS